MSPCAPIRSDCACSRSLSAPPRIASSSRWRFSTGLRERQPRLRLVDAGDGGDQIVLALHELARLDREQRRAALDDVARLGDQAADAAGEGREDRRGGVLVDRDLAVGRALVAERDLAHRRELEARPLRLARPEGAVGIARHLLRPRHGIARAAVEHPEAGDDGSDGHDAAAREPQAIAPETRWSNSRGASVGHENAVPFDRKHRLKNERKLAPFLLRQPDAPALRSRRAMVALQARGQDQGGSNTNAGASRRRQPRACVPPDQGSGSERLRRPIRSARSATPFTFSRP